MFDGRFYLIAELCAINGDLCAVMAAVRLTIYPRSHSKGRGLKPRIFRAFALEVPRSFVP